MKGKVYLVGAGPGDPDLLTLKALRVLRSADVVLHDALVSAEILALLPRPAKLLNVGKRCGRKAITQEQINSLLVEFAQEGRTVVRLKSGDPLIFGRAGEEIETLLQAGIDFEIVPGITAGVAAAATLQIPLTDRRSASRILFLTAHRAPGNGDADWSSIASADTTAVIYMPGDDYGKVADRLRAAGVPEDRPCAIVANVSRPEQQVYVTNVGGLESALTLPVPAVIVVGRTAAAAASTDLLLGSEWIGRVSQTALAY